MLRLTNLTGPVVNGDNDPHGQERVDKKYDQQVEFQCEIEAGIRTHTSSHSSLTAQGWGHASVKHAESQHIKIKKHHYPLTP